MAESGITRAPQTIPNTSRPVHGEQQSRALYFLRATSPQFSIISAGNPSRELVIRPLQTYDRPAQRYIPTRSYIPKAAAGAIQAPALVHTRTLGAPVVKPQLRPAGLDHFKALGGPTVIPPPVIPPVIPPPTPTVAVTTPRNLRSVRVRNTEERD